MRRGVPLAVAAVLLAGACSASSSPPPGLTTTPPAPTSPSPTTPVATPTTAAPMTEPPTTEQVGAQGTKVRSDGATVHVLPAAGVRMTDRADDDGSVHLTFVAPPGATSATPLAYVSGKAADAFADGTATAGGGGLSPDGGTLAASSDDVLVLLPRRDDDVRVWFAGTTIAATRWGNQEGGRSLAVTPTAWARAGGLAAHALTWSQLVQREPDADSTTMQDQLQCHELGAPDKATWNLEPWRPEVGGLEMIAARCNPS